MSDKNELELVRRLRSCLPAPTRDPAAAAPRDFVDDMAAIGPAHTNLLWTTDLVADGVDFDSRVHTPAQIGRKAMAVNLSDCAAMAVRPVSALCAVILQRDFKLDAAQGLLRAAHDCGMEHGCPIVGGDTNVWEHPTAIAITVAGAPTPQMTPIRRDTARAGDSVWLTGRCGGSILGRHMTFSPRVGLAIEIAQRLRPTAMIDVSDGVSLDLWRVAEASALGAVIFEPDLDSAIHADAVALARQDGRSPRDHALADGEDFELIVVAPPESDEPARQMGLLPLGKMVAERGLWLEAAAGERQPLAPRGWTYDFNRK